MDEAERCTDLAYIYHSRLLVSGPNDRLKRLPQITPPGTVRYRLEIPDPTGHLSQLRRMPHVRDATLFGQSIHMLASDELRPEGLPRALGLSPSEGEVHRATPSLEDVFVTLTARRRRPRRRKAGRDDRGRRGRRRAGAAAPGPPGRAGRGDSAPPGSVAEAATARTRSTAGLAAILRKEFVHIRRQPSTIFFILLLPVMQTLIFGFAINVEVENIPTVVHDMDGRQASRDLVEAFRQSRTFRLIEPVHDSESFRRALTSGRAKVGILIPSDYSDRLLRGQQAQAQVLIDGSDSTIATAALQGANLLGSNRAIAITRDSQETTGQPSARGARGRQPCRWTSAPRLLYNPDLKSSYFFVPGLVGIILQMVTLFLTAFSVVREREMGTLEQLFVTPVGRAGLMAGKLLPYAVVGFVETMIVLVVMTYLFGVPIRGSIPLLLSLSAPFLVCAWGWA